MPLTLVVKEGEGLLFRLKITLSMRQDEGLPFVKLMMLLSSMAPLFLLAATRGMDEIVNSRVLWIVTGLLILIPFGVIRLRIQLAKKSNDTFTLNVSRAENNKEYLFTYLFTVLLPLYSISITNIREFLAVVLAICFVIFVLWNMNLHFANVLFAFWGYRVFTIVSFDSAILLTSRSSIPTELNQLKVHRLSNTVFIELKKFDYGNN